MYERFRKYALTTENKPAFIGDIGTKKTAGLRKTTA